MLRKILGAFFAPQATVRVTYVDSREIDDMAGQWSPTDKTVRIAKGFAPTDEQIILVHELLHVADDLVPGKKRISHNDIARIAPTLVQLLVACGGWPAARWTVEDIADAQARLVSAAASGEFARGID